MVTTLALVIASIVSLKTRWHTFTIEGFFLTYRPDNTFVIHDRTKMSFEFDLIQFLVLVVAAGLLIGAALAMRALRTSLKVVVGVRSSAIRGSHPQKVPLRQVRAHAAHEFANRL